jgi:hypothetical protein
MKGKVLKRFGDDSCKYCITEEYVLNSSEVVGVPYVPPALGVVAEIPIQGFPGS